MTTATQEVRTSAQWQAEVERLEAELEALPARAKAHRELAIESVDDKIITSSLATATEIEQVTLPATRIKLKHAKRNYLLAREAELVALEKELLASAIAASEKQAPAQREIDIAEARKKAVDQNIKTAAGKHRGVLIEIDEVRKQLALLEREPLII